MLILITNGTYGHSPILPSGKKSPYVVPVNRKSGPIDVEKGEAERLVKAGVAEYVTGTPAKEAKAPEPESSGNAPEMEIKTETETGDVKGTDLEGMTFSELKALAQEMGIETGKIKSKAAMIQAISEQTEESIPAGDLPDLNAQDVVD